MTIPRLELPRRRSLMNRSAKERGDPHRVGVEQGVRRSDNRRHWVRYELL